MKKLVFLLLAAIGLAFPDGTTIVGQGNVNRTYVTWNTGANTGKFSLLFRGNSVFLDTSTSGRSGSWKRIDNTADSCSQAFNIGGDSLGGTRPIWETVRFWALVRAVKPESSTFLLRVPTREIDSISKAGARVYTPWTVVNNGANIGWVDFTIVDSVVVPSLGAGRTASTVSQYAYVNVTGTQARVCPDDVAATTNDSLFVILRSYSR